MSTANEAYAAIEVMLAKTEGQELDCDQFLELLAPYLDQRVDDPALVRLIEHHRDLCAECAEELSLLSGALSDES